MYSLLFIDDDPDVLSTLKRSFRKGYQVFTAPNGEEGIQVLNEHPVNLIICDQRMPGLTGDQVLLHAYQTQPKAIRILLTGYSDMDSLVNCVNDAHIYKYVSKPWEPEDLRLTVIRALEAHELQTQLDQAHQQLELAYQDAIKMLCTAAEGKDEDTASHLLRVQFYTEALAKKVGIEVEEAEHWGVMSILHDIGKMNIPDAILKKPGKLTDDEWNVMRTHPVAGSRILGDNPFYEVARIVAAGHHENYDGSGYPKGLKGDEIPLAAQIVKITDVFDALTTQRPYKKAWPMEEAIAYLQESKGKQFAPDLIDQFMALYQDGVIQDIKQRHSDSANES
jgi:putative two-component system response regulator